MTNPALKITVDRDVLSRDAFEASGKAEQFRHFRRSRKPFLQTLDTIDTLDGGKGWQRGVSDLIALPCPSFSSFLDWDTLCFRVFQFASEWADDGLRYGWTTLDMFGCNRDPSARRVDRNGVAITIGRMLSPLTVCAVDRDAWHFADQHGSIMRFPRMDRVGQVPMWIAYAPTAAP